MKPDFWTAGWKEVAHCRMNNCFPVERAVDGTLRNSRRKGTVGLFPVSVEQSDKGQVLIDGMRTKVE